jgi:DNA polymerase-3 subunit epsilon
MSPSLAFIDFETTGLSPESGDRIIEVGVAILAEGCIVDRYQSFTAPKAMQVMPEVLKFVGDLPLVAHNASFDKRFMDSELRRIGQRRANEFICSLRVARRVYPAAPNHKLATLVRLAGVQPAEQYHRALGDAEMTARLWTGMVENIERQHGIEAVSLELMQSLQTCGVARAAETIARYA